MNRCRRGGSGGGSFAACRPWSCLLSLPPPPLIHITSSFLPSSFKCGPLVLIPNSIGQIIIPALQMRKLRLGTVTQCLEESSKLRGLVDLDVSCLSRLPFHSLPVSSVCKPQLLASLLSVCTFQNPLNPASARSPPPLL